MKSKKLQIGITIVVIVVFIYTLWSTIIWMRKKDNKQWTVAQKEQMISTAINSSRILSSMDSVTAHDIGSCVIEKMISHFSYDEIWKWEDMSKSGDSSFVKNVLPLVQQCFSEFNVDVEFQRQVANCITGVRNKNPNLTPEAAKGYCNCFMGYLRAKYDSLYLNDSIVLSEKSKAQQCLQDAQQSDSLH